MDDKWSYGFSLPDLLKGNRVTTEEAEVLLQGYLLQKLAEFENAIWKLLYFYSSHKQQETAANYIYLLMSLTDDPEKHAACLLALVPDDGAVPELPGRELLQAGL